MLEQLIKAKGLTQKELAARLSVKPSSVNQWVKGTSRPDPSRLASLASELGVTTDVLLGANPVVPAKEELGKYTTGNIKAVGANHLELYTYIPFLSARAQAGLPTMILENCELKLDETYPVFVQNLNVNNRQLVIEVTGDSMEPGILSGAIVLAESVTKNDIKYESGGVYAVMYANRFVIKRIKTNEINVNGTLKLWSDNDKYGHITLHGEDIDCMWKVMMKVSEPVR